ncbi:hypothetical protein [Novosphingobium sp. PASSN1]|uniref:hypothetical protein n=1 Tax=Novosphingobium sp. PASSN1 TaxID=2015561 RepID=UPI0025CD24EF|nr:hypothetical protein [Novosphingobium sp. PASSN1]
MTTCSLADSLACTPLADLRIPMVNAARKRGLRPPRRLAYWAITGKFPVTDTVGAQLVTGR